MRVGFTGAQGTGKTTLLKAVEQSGLGFTIVPSTARAAVAAGYKVNRDADPLSQLLTTMSRVVAENGIYEATKRSISDRTPLDSLAYTYYQAGKMWLNEKPNEFYIGVSCEFVVQHMKKYDHIFYFPVYWPPKADGVRDPDEEYQKSIDGTILALLDMFEISYHTVPKANTQERLSWLTKTLNL